MTDREIDQNVVADVEFAELGPTWAWARRGLSTDICPLVAVSLARWATQPVHT